MTGLGKLFIVGGGAMIAVGLIIVLAGRANLPIGRLPGDIVYRGKNSSFYFPLATCILISVFLSLVMWVIGRFSR